MRAPAGWMAVLLALASTACTGDPGDDAVTQGACKAGDPAEDVPGCDAGVPPERCAEGFDEDGDKGCIAIMPSSACAPGTFAVPGETTCREPASCDAGTWGDAPVGAATQYVDASYDGGDSDGTEGAPWLTIVDAIAAAADGAVIAIAAGSYAEDVVLTKPVALWGRCPAMVEIVGSSAPQTGAVEVDPGAAGAEIHNLAITGETGGLFVSGATDVVVSGLWVHDTAGRGIAVQNDFGGASVAIDNTLVEGASDFALQALGVDVTVDGCALRATRENTNFSTGYGMAIQRSSDSAVPSEVIVRGSVLELNHTAALLVSGSNVTVEGTLLRDSEPSELSSRDGVGVIAQDKDGEPANLIMTSCVVSGTYSRGIAVVGSTAQIEATHVREVRPQEWDQNTGEAVAIESSADSQADVTLRECKLEQSHSSGVFVRGSKSSLERVLIRDVAPRGSDDAFGRGIAAVSDTNGNRSELGVDACMIENVFAVGVWVGDSDGIIAGTIVREVAVQRFDGLLGDGIAAGTLEPELGQASLVVSGSRSEGHGRSGFMLMGAALDLSQSSSECNEWDVLAFTRYNGVENDFAYDDGGANRCGCGTSTRPCEAELGQ